jgi:hypothetical protein
LGPNVEAYRELFGVHEDQSTPNCNTGVISVKREDWHLIETNLEKHFANPFMIMEDQGIMLASFHGELTYAEGIKCIINNAEAQPSLWGWVLQQRAAHLMGMRTRPQGLTSIIETALAMLPDTIHLSQIIPSAQYSSWGLISYGHYRFTHPLQKIPSTSSGTFVNDALYLHGGSWARWDLAPAFDRFTSHIVCMDTGIAENVFPITINGDIYHLGDEINIPLDGKLEIITQNGPGSHIAFLEPTLHIDKTRGDLPERLTAGQVSAN